MSRRIKSQKVEKCVLKRCDVLMPLQMHYSLLITRHAEIQFHPDTHVTCLASRSEIFSLSGWKSPLRDHFFVYLTWTRCLLSAPNCSVSAQCTAACSRWGCRRTGQKQCPACQLTRNQILHNTVLRLKLQIAFCSLNRFF